MRRKPNTGSFGYWLRSRKRPYPLLAFVGQDDCPAKVVPFIGQVVDVLGMEGLVDSYDVVPLPPGEIRE